mgnify:CR=1 FL=1
MKQEVHQFSMFDEFIDFEREFQLHHAMDDIKSKFGKNSVNRASSELGSSTIKARNDMIGGHHA